MNVCMKELLSIYTTVRTISTISCLCLKVLYIEIMYINFTLKMLNNTYRFPLVDITFFSNSSIFLECFTNRLCTNNGNKNNE